MSIIQKWNSISLVKRIVCGLIIGAILGLLIPQVKVIGVLGTLFVGALKAVAPILVFFLVIAALACGQEGGGRTMGRVVALYLIGTFAAAVVAVLACHFIHIVLPLGNAASTDGYTAAGGIGEVFSNLLNNIVSNPIGSMVNANYLGILFWAVIFGLALKKASDTTKKALNDFSEAVTAAVRAVISCAPFGIPHGVTVDITTVTNAPASPATPPDSEVVLRLSAGIREIYGIEPHCDGSGGGTVAVGFRDMGIPAAVWASVVPTYHLANEYSLISRTIGDAQVLARMLFD